MGANTNTPRHTRGRTTRRWREKIRPHCRRRDQQANAPCWICGQPIDYTIPDGQPEAWSPDHLTPLAADPNLAEDPANIRASHLNCNKSRRDKPANLTGLGNQSRNW